MSLGVLTETRINGGIWALRRRLELVFGRLRGGAWPIVQTAVAATVAWFIAATVLGHEQPFFAAIAAVVSLGVAVGQEGRRAAELVFGVACGLAVADTIALAIGTGPLQIGAVVALAMAAAILLGGGSLLITEAGVSALLAVTLEPSTQGLSPDRFFDALVGGGVALAISALFPNDPRRMVERAAYPIFDELIVMLGETTAALHTDDLRLAEQALGKARELDARVSVLKEALAAGYGTARLSPPGRRYLGYLARYASVADQLDLAVRNTRVLARAAVSLLQDDKHAPEVLSEALLDLARAVETLGIYLQRSDHLDTRHFALKAAEEATAALKERNDLETSVLVGQVRSTAMDLLRASGMDPNDSLHALRVAARHASEEEPTER
ncbi:MAG TPA: FUSC family protein [Rubrobacteraceae bacterium]|nr:FUSC family protein [Rubrobacteraceae bacterium]